MAPQFRSSSGWSGWGPSVCSASTTSSLPEPVGPVTSTGRSDSAARRMVSRRTSIAVDTPTSRLATGSASAPARAQLAQLVLQAAPAADAVQHGQHQLVAQVVLQDVVVGAHAHRHPDLGDLLVGGDDDGDDRGARADLLDQHQPVAVARVRRQPQIDERHVERLLLEHPAGGHQAVSFMDLGVVELADDGRQHAPRARLIVDDEDPHGAEP